MVPSGRRCLPASSHSRNAWACGLMPADCCRGCIALLHVRCPREIAGTGMSPEGSGRPRRDYYYYYGGEVTALLEVRAGKDAATGATAPMGAALGHLLRQLGGFLNTPHDS